MYDIAIIGGGPAGVSAAINARLLGKNFIWMGSRPTSLKAEKAELVKNYPGLPDATGEELSWAFKQHAESMNIPFSVRAVTGVYETGGKFSVLAGNEETEARTVILCLGVNAQKPVEGEEEFLGRGVSYCATCDGMLYRGKTIAVAVYDGQFESEVEFLCEIAGTCYVIPLYKGYKGAPAKGKEIIKAPIKYAGGRRVEEVVFKDGKLAVDGVFVLRPSISYTALVHGLATVGGHIAVDRACATNIPGIFAAGDCTGLPYQYAKAVGEGNVAAHSAAQYLSENKGS